MKNPVVYCKESFLYEGDSLAAALTLITHSFSLIMEIHVHVASPHFFVYVESHMFDYAL